MRRIPSGTILVALLVGFTIFSAVMALRSGL
jgi:hypothetical protein